MPFPTLQRNPTPVIQPRSQKRNLVRGGTVCIILCLLGCGQSDPTVVQVTQTAATLEKTSLTHYQPLKDELHRLESDRAMPEQIDARTTTAVSPNSFAGSISTLLESNQSERILSRLPEFFPVNGQNPNALTLEKASGFLKFYKQQQLAARKSLEGPQDRFQWKASDGWFIDTSYAEKSQAICGLELIAGLDAVSQGQMSETIEALGYSGRIIRLLANDEHLVARLTAVNLRTQWLQLVAISVAHPELERSHLEQIYQLLLNHISQWPDESKPWITDRAIGLQTYELVRQGNYLSLLSKEEADALEADGMHIIKSRAIQRFVDQDEVFYLDTMRRIIDANSMTYYRREPLWSSIDKSIEAAKQTEHYPQVAIELLLPDIQNAQKRIANDRARVEAWTLALANCIGKNPPTYVTNPATGEPYQILKDSSVVEVTGLSPEQFPRPVIAPVRQ